MSYKDGGPAFPCSKCGTSVKFLAAWQKKDKRCPSCKRAQQNAANLAKGDALKEEAKKAYARRKDYYAAYWKKKKDDPLHILKRRARRKVSTEIEAGRLKRQPCEKCRNDPADAHHADYLKPLVIQWLCRRCHFAADAMLKEREK